MRTLKLFRSTVTGETRYIAMRDDEARAYSRTTTYVLVSDTGIAA